MSQSLAALYTHVVFSTKNRVPHLAERSIRVQVHANLRAASDFVKCPALCVGGATDHVHLLVRLARTISMSDCVKELKRVSSAQAKILTPSLREFSWQAGYGAFSVSRGDVDAVQQYIQTQEEHHKLITFKEEYLRLLSENEIEWDERYIWD